MPNQHPPKANRPASSGDKGRWTESDRRKREERTAARGERPGQPRGERPVRPAKGERPDWSPRPARDNAARPARDGAERPARREWTPREDRPARQWEPRESRVPREDRPRTEDRTPRREWTPREDRAPRSDDRAPRRDWNDRPARAGQERPARPYQDRPARPYQDRPVRPAKGERPDWSPRPPRDGATRPARDSAERPARREWQPREDRPRTDDRAPRREWTPREDRAPRTDDRAPRRDWNDRPARDDRPARAERPRFEDRAPRDDRAPRQFTEDVVLDRLQASAIAADATDGMTFSDLGFGDNIVRQLASMGATEPFPIQAATIPMALAGRDVLGRGRTGSGKTIAFGAPVVERLLRLHRDANPSTRSARSGQRPEEDGGRGRSMGRRPRALILAPTRELAQQIDGTVQPIARSVGLFTIAIVGGVPYHKQVTGLHRGVDIVIGTPGRIADLVTQGELDLSGIVISVLDEADHMCDLGFLEPVQDLLRQTPADGQRLLYSATLDSGVAKLVDEFLTDPAVHEVEGEDQASSTIDHKVLVIEQRDKRQVVVELAADGGRTIVFTRTRAFAEELAEHLEDAGIRATSLHGDLNQSRRNRNLALLTGGRVSVLVATDVAARGIHVDDVSLVIQADAAEDYKTYLHRSGRTGRAGKEGTVVTLVPRNRQRKMAELLERAEIVADSVTVAPGHPLLGELAAR